MTGREALIARLKVMHDACWSRLEWGTGNQIDADDLRTLADAIATLDAQTAALRSELEQQRSHIASLENRLTLREPHLTCHIDQVVIGQAPETLATAITLILSVRNEGEASVAEGWRVFLTLRDSARRELGIVHAPSGVQLGISGGGTVMVSGPIYDKTATPVPRGGMVRGFCACEPLTVPAETVCAAGTVFEVECRDVTGRRVSTEWAWSDTRMGPKYFPAFDQTFTDNQ